MLRRRLRLPRTCSAPAHPDVASALFDLATRGGAGGGFSPRRGRISERALGIGRESGTTAQHSMGVVVGELGLLDALARDNDAAWTHLSEAVRFNEEKLGDSIRTLDAYAALGGLELRMGRLAEARSVFLRGRAMVERLKLTYPDYELFMTTGLASVDLAEGHARRALPDPRTNGPPLRGSRSGARRGRDRQLCLLARALAAVHEQPARVRQLAVAARTTWAANAMWNAVELSELDAFLAVHP